MNRDLKSILRTLEKSIDMHMAQLAMLGTARERIEALEDRVRDLEGNMSNETKETVRA